MTLGLIAFLAMGLTLGLIGGGGSILTVPILVYLYGVSALPATAYSLLIVGVTALAGALLAYRRGEVSVKIGALFAAPSFIGVYATRAWIMPRVPDPVFSFGAVPISKPLFILALFAILMILASFSMIRSAPTVAPTNPAPTTKPAWTLVATEGLIVGAVTGFVGAGGGFLIIPALVLLTRLPMKIAVGTSLGIIAVKSLVGFAGDLQSGFHPDWKMLLPILALSLIGLGVGAALKSRVSDAALKRGFGYFVLVLGGGMLLQQLLTLKSA